MQTERFVFPGAQGQNLSARLDGPDGPVLAYAVFAHCFTCGKNTLAAGRIAARLADRGIATLRFDFTGLGASDGDFGNEGFSSNIEDLQAAVAAMAARSQAPSLLIGHSLGGAAVLAAAGDMPGIKAVATIGAPLEPAHVLKLLGPGQAEIEAEGRAVVTLAGRDFTITRRFLDDLTGQTRQADRIARLHHPLLIFHSPIDDTVDVDNARAIFQAARHPKSFVSLDGADHLLTRRTDADYVADLLSAWAARYLEPAAEAETADAPAGQVVVEESGRGRLQQTVRIGRHHLLADEPVAQGGGDTGPGPYDFLLTALGACTAMTLRLYAERKALPLGRVRVTLGHRKIHAEDCAECETRTGMLDEISREIALEGDLSAEQQARLMEIADKCPVHRTLHSEIRIVTRQVT